ncbi:MAG: Gfo/Idh/MocA family oxidoreductase [Actinobacteria bacterium]|nr:Gfo/Idh/MocA family oxidoreductase [Actinomycetota bacterium]
MTDGALRLGILGAARISLGGIIPAASRTDAVEVAAVATRGGEKARTVREAAPEAELFEDYASLIESAEVDAVYVPLPNSMHVEWTLKALEAGKHVLCEKPFSLDAEGAERAIEAARSAGLALMEGFMYRLHPQTIRLAQLLREGAVGEVRQVVAEFGHRLDDPEDVRGVGALGGGSLGDVGCYCVSGLRLAFGVEPRRATAFGRFDEDGADRDLTGVLEFDEGLAFVSCSISSARRERLEIAGTDGRITLTAPFRPDKAGGTMEIERGDEASIEHFGQSDPYRLELEEFAAAIREGRDPAVGPREILGNARAIEAILESARSGGNLREV